MPNKNQPAADFQVPHKQEQTEETRRDRFERIGSARMNRVLNSIRLLANLSSPHYEWGTEDIQAMQSAILKELDLAFAPFAKKAQSVQKPSFDFKRVPEDATAH